MKRAIRFAASLYPKEWRERYGAEFAALLEDMPVYWWTPFDIVKGSLAVQLTSWNAKRILAASAALGALVAFGFSFAVPNQYQSQAALQITPDSVQSTMTASVIDQEVTDQINSISQIILKRTTLTTIINTFGLYESERNRMQIKDVLDLMRKNIQILPLPGVVDDGRRLSAFAVQFSYENRDLAHQVDQELVSRYLDQNTRATSNVMAISLQLLDLPSWPQGPVSPKRSVPTAIGLAAGLALGWFVVYFRWLNKRAVMLDKVGPAT